MQRILAVTCVLAAAVLILAGCPAPSEAPEYYLTCRIDGVALSLVAGPSGTPDARQGVGTIALDGFPAGYVDLGSTTYVLASTSAIDLTGSTFTFNTQDGAFYIALYGVSGTGDFTIGLGDGGILKFNTPDGEMTYDAGTTTITGTVTEFGAVGGAIEGTFTGTIMDQSEGSHAITEGSFRVKRYEPFYDDVS